MFFGDPRIEDQNQNCAVIDWISIKSNDNNTLLNWYWNNPLGQDSKSNFFFIFSNTDLFDSMTDPFMSGHHVPMISELQK